MKALKYIFFLVLIAVIALAIYIAVQPNNYKVSRTRTMQVPAAVVYDNVIDFNNWMAWNSWIEKNPEMKVTFPEQTKGIGSFYTWEDENGIGKMTTIETNPNKSITQEMQFGDYPKSDVDWKFNPNEDSSTDVTWSIEGNNLPFGFKAYVAFMGGMEAQIAPEYERSLENLDSILQIEIKKYNIIVDKTPTEHSGGYFIYNTTAAQFDDYKSKIADMLPKVISYAEKNNITMAGAPFIQYHKWDEENNTVMFSCCVPTSARVITTTNDVLTGQLHPFKAIKTTLSGSYDNLQKAWDMAFADIEKNGYIQKAEGPVIEAYLNTPLNTPNPANLKTEIFIAVE